MSLPQRHALVIGAGLAGAAVTAALIRRGWRVDLLDGAEQPAQGASALPVGMLSPHVTRAPTPLSRLTALGVPVTRAELERLVPPGAGWMPVQVTNLGHDPGRRPAALVRPSALVRAWLDEAAASGRLGWHPGALVQSLQRDATGWTALGAQGAWRAPVVVVACALDSARLLAPLGAPLPLHPVQGQLSGGALPHEGLGDEPRRDEGVFVPRYEDLGQPAPWPSALWSVGSTYERGRTDTRVTDEAHRRNAERLRQIAPAAAAALEPLLAQGLWLGWAGVRCASRDRLPLVGAVPEAGGPSTGAPRTVTGPHEMPRVTGLHILAALGSRGLALAAWAGQWLAARLDGEPDELPPDLRDAIDPARFLWREARRAPRQSSSSH